MLMYEEGACEDEGLVFAERALTRAGILAEGGLARKAYRGPLWTEVAYQRPKVDFRSAAATS